MARRRHRRRRRRCEKSAQADRGSAFAERLWDSVPDLPTLVWGRDELGAGEMWNSNSIVSWLLVRSGLAIEAIQPPTGGRAPRWNAGIVIAQRAAAGSPANIAARI